MEQLDNYTNKLDIQREEETQAVIPTNNGDNPDNIEAINTKIKLLEKYEPEQKAKIDELMSLISDKKNNLSDNQKRDLTDKISKYMLAGYLEVKYRCDKDMYIYADAYKILAENCKKELDKTIEDCKEKNKVLGKYTAERVSSAKRPPSALPIGTPKS